MVAPLPGELPFLDRLYGGLPEHYRLADDALDQPLFRWLAGICGVAAVVEALIDRIDYVTPGDGGLPGDTSGLGDPAEADPPWLPWLGQMVGVSINPAVPVQAQRDAVEGAVSGFRAGTKGAMGAAAKALLTGTQFVIVYDHTINSPGDGGQWDMLLVTRDAETPITGDELIDRIEAQGAKPVGVILHHRSYTAPWDAVDGEYQTWGETDGLSWNQMDDTGL